MIRLHAWQAVGKKRQDKCVAQRVPDSVVDCNGGVIIGSTHTDFLLTALVVFRSSALAHLGRVASLSKMKLEFLNRLGIEGCVVSKDLLNVCSQ